MIANEAQIAEVERHFGVRFPEDYRTFLLTRGSSAEFVPPAGCYLRIDPIDTMIGINEAGCIQERFPEAIIIGGDGSREMLVYDFRSDPPPLRLLDIAAPDWTSGIYQALSLTEFLAQFPQQGWLFE